MVVLISIAISLLIIVLLLSIVYDIVFMQTLFTNPFLLITRTNPYHLGLQILYIMPQLFRHFRLQLILPHIITFRSH